MKRSSIVAIVLIALGAAALTLALFWVRSAPPEDDPAAALATDPAWQPGPPKGTVLSAMQATGTCKDCREKHCRSYLHTDVIGGCFEKPDKLVEKPDENFTKDCKAAVQCAYEHKCGYAEMPGPFGCYCGSANATECYEKGPAKDAPCVEEWKRATRSTSHGEISHRFDDIQYPSGWAFQVLWCDRVHCGEKSKDGRCTPP